MITIIPKQFVEGMWIRILGLEHAGWVLIERIFSRHVPNLDNGGESLIVFKTNYGIAIHKYTSEVKYELHPEWLHLLR